MEFYTLASGSGGNCSLVRTEKEVLLFDVGISCRRIERSLDHLGLSLGEVSAVFITHEHADHISGLDALSRKCAAPIYASCGSARTLPERVIPFTAGDSFALESCTERSFATSHDAAEPVGYRIDGTDGSLGILTDTGYVTEAAADALLGVDMLLLEANHDVELLQSGPYPDFLKRRILGARGHLSNADAAEFAIRAVGGGANDIILAHISEENNTPELAEYTIIRALESADYFAGIRIAPRNELSEVHICKKSLSFALES